jgi:hypothetical protein
VENNFSGALLSERGFQVTGRGVRIPVRLPWYRSLPLSVIEVYGLKVDGSVVTPDAVQIEINGKQISAASLGDLTDEWWYVLDDAVLDVTVPNLAPGPVHQVELTLNLYPPYIPGLTWATQSARLLRAQ